MLKEKKIAVHHFHLPPCACKSYNHNLDNNNILMLIYNLKLYNTLNR